MPTIYDVAKRARVSTYTVSTVLNRTAAVSPELTKRVLEAVRELDYTINELARGLQMRRTRTIGMLIPDIANPFYAKVVRGVEDVLRGATYSLLLGSTYNDPVEQSRYVGVFRSRQVDGLLLFVAPGESPEVQALARERKPLVFVGRLPIHFDADSVSADNTLGAELAVAHLASKGHRRIGLVNGQTGLSSSAERVAGWKRALKRVGGSTAARYVIHCDWTASCGHDAALKLADLPQPPTAVFTANFLMMTGVLKALKERGLSCPEDVEVMSSDDSEWLDVFEPRISTVAQPSYEMGTEAAQLVLKRIASPDRPFKRVVLQPRLMLR
ncbi:MAG: LacI family DNA-binding transcriptional regulator [Bryobacteraceae bacterium]|nr:LacI family DNA-binding transcriptional regulator [Bryobacteraceae bacterium]